MVLDKKIIAVGGNARSGKDTLANNLVDILAELNIKAKKVSFAHALRESVDDFLLRELGSFWTLTRWIEPYFAGIL